MKVKRWLRFSGFCCVHRNGSKNNMTHTDDDDDDGVDGVDDDNEIHLFEQQEQDMLEIQMPAVASRSESSGST